MFAWGKKSSEPGSAAHDDVMTREAALDQLLDEETVTYQRRTRRSLALLRQLAVRLPLGVASSFQVHYPYPLVMERGKGAYLTDVDGNRYLDLHSGFGANVCGHAHPAIARALRTQLGRGTHYATPLPQLLAYSQELCRRFGLDQVRLTNSGTEATMEAVRLARAFTGRSRVVKTEGAYHGHHDLLMVSAEPGPDGALVPVANCQGIPDSVLGEVSVVAFNDLEGLASMLDRYPDTACVIMEPVMLNMGLVLPDPGYLEGVRSLCDTYDVLLIFDQVKTGLTVAAGGAGELYDVHADLHCLGKAIGGGLPVGAVGGNRSIMDLIRTGQVTHYGTFSGNPLTVTAGLAALTEILTSSAYEQMAALNRQLCEELDVLIERYELPCHTRWVGAKGGVFFSRDGVRDHRDFEAVDAKLAQAGWLWMVNRGVLMAPGADEQWTLSVAMTERDIARVVRAFGSFARRAARLPAQ